MSGGDLSDGLALSDRHALSFGFNTTFGSTGYESKLRSLVAQASTNPSVPVDRVSDGPEVTLVSISYRVTRSYLVKSQVYLTLLEPSANVFKKETAVVSDRYTLVGLVADVVGG